jgi:hypothetical protein
MRKACSCVAPREDGLQRGMEGGRRYVATDDNTAQISRADALQDHTELVDAKSNPMRLAQRGAPCHTSVYLGDPAMLPCTLLDIAQEEHAQMLAAL